MNRLSGVLLLIYSLQRATSDEECKSSFCSSGNFKTYDLESSRLFDSFNPISTLQLVSAGMRKKNLFVVEVDVYVVGVYLSDGSLQQLISKGFAGNEHSLTPSVTEDTIPLCFVLKFVRSVGSSKVVNAIVEALSGDGEDYNNQLSKFQQMLSSSLGNGGAVKGDEIVFAYKGKDELGISFKNEFKGWIRSEELRNRLADIYTGPKAVAPEVRQILHSAFMS